MPPRLSSLLGRLGSGHLALLLLAALVLSPLRWWLTRPSPWRVVVADKTVPRPDYREHAALFWVLSHARAPAPGHRGAWDPARDYLGYHPQAAGGSPAWEDLTPAGLAGADLLFLADTYGVYEQDTGGVATPDYSARVYGGVTAAEVATIARFLRHGGVLVAEFNSFASPTRPEERQRLEAMLGLAWTGWAGRYFAELGDATEVPAWARRAWRARVGRDWNLTGPGYLFVHEDGRIQVLRYGPDAGNLWIEHDGGDPLLRGAARAVPFYFWFDVVRPLPGTRVLARYRFDLTARGREALRLAGLPETFPAILRASGSPPRFYLAGDFSDNLLARGPHWLSGWPRFRRALGFAERHHRDQGAFYWGLYVPLLQNLLATSPRAL